jgi:hypothetical protein
LAEYVELLIEQGVTFISAITVKDADDNPLNLSSFSVTSQLRKSYYSSTAIDFDIVVDQPETGIIGLEMNAEKTSNIRPGRYVYDVKIQDELGDAIRVFEGIVTVTPGVTKT